MADVEDFIIRNPGDPFNMEYILDKINDEQQREALIANGFATLANVYAALAEGARNAAGIVTGGD